MVSRPKPASSSSARLMSASTVDEFTRIPMPRFTDGTAAGNTTYFYRIAGVGARATEPFSAGVEVTTGITRRRA